ncbi:MAG: STAS domain-containing protein [Acidobacteriota bacterium]
MQIRKRTIQGMTVLDIEGLIKLGQSAEAFATTLQKILDEEEGHVLIHLAHINHIDSTGIGELVGYLGRFRTQDRKLILVQPSDRIRRLLDMAQLQTLFPIYDDLDAALAAEA